MAELIFYLSYEDCFVEFLQVIRPRKIIVLVDEAGLSSQILLQLYNTLDTSRLLQ